MAISIMTLTTLFLQNKKKRGKKNMKTKLSTIFQWISISILELFLFFWLFATVVTGSFVSAIILVVIMVAVFPPVYNRIPKFKGKTLVAVFSCIFLFCLSFWYIDFSVTDSATVEEVSGEIPEKEPAELAEVDEAKKEETKAEPVPVKKEDPEQVIEEEEEEPATLSEEEIQKNRREYMDSLTTEEWIRENISVKIEGGEFDTEGFESRRTDDFYKAWCNVVETWIKTDFYEIGLTTYCENPGLLDYQCDFLESSIELLSKIYPDNEVVKKYDELFYEAINPGRELASYLNLHYDDYMESIDKIKKTYYLVEEYDHYFHDTYYDGNEDLNQRLYPFSEGEAFIEDFMVPKEENVREFRDKLLDDDLILMDMEELDQGSGVYYKFFGMEEEYTY